MFKVIDYIPVRIGVNHLKQLMYGALAEPYWKWSRGYRMPPFSVCSLKWKTLSDMLPPKDQEDIDAIFEHFLLNRTEIGKRKEPSLRLKTTMLDLLLEIPYSFYCEANLHRQCIEDGIVGLPTV